MRVYVFFVFFSAELARRRDGMAGFVVVVKFDDVISIWILKRISIFFIIYFFFFVVVANTTSCTTYWLR